MTSMLIEFYYREENQIFVDRKELVIGSIMQKLISLSVEITIVFA